MKNLSNPLTEDELDRLGDFLLERVDDKHHDDPDYDCGIIDVSSLDGYLTAIVSGPNPINPSVWMPGVWGEEEPVWESVKEFQSIFSLIVRHMNSIATALQADRGTFEPLFMENRAGGKAHLVVDEWCFGYMTGVGLDSAAWKLSDAAVAEMLEPIKLYGTEEGWKTLDALPQAEALRHRDAIPKAVRNVYAYWLARRAQKAPPQRRDSAKVGRNDPCPCGSGKKYKHCCLQ
jgi:uncharacterized protein